MYKLSDLRLRDPFILPHDGIYYLYGTFLGYENDGPADSLFTFTSTNLTDWEGPKKIFTLPENAEWGAPLWAPEVHTYKGKFYLFLSVLGPEGTRGTQIFGSDRPDGPFLPLSNRPATPAEQSCIDGTLFVESGVPYMVYSHDWPDCYVEKIDSYVGEIAAIPLSDDLTKAAGEPFILFSSLDAPYSAAGPTPATLHGKPITRHGSDGPFVTRLRDGRLLLVWSPIPARNYIVGAAVSDSIRGPWTHLDTLLFDTDGGHAMFFEDFNGQKKMVLHTPNTWGEERTAVFDMTEEDGMLKTK